jgi:RNA polymerase sigma-70 factor (ECF subfamily)
MAVAMATSDEGGSSAQESALSDEEVVRRIREGETALFEVLMRRYNQRLFRVARAILRDEAEAEDVMQQAYVNAYTHLHQFEERARFGTWLTRIAVNEALVRLRRRGRVEEVDAMPELDERTMDVLSSKALNPEEQALRRELRAILESSFEAIPEIYRSVFMLREVEGLSTTEAAECLGLSEDAVKTRLHRARALLRQELFERAGLATAELFPLHLSRCDRVVAAVFAHLNLPPPPSLHCGCPGEFCHAVSREFSGPDVRS